MENKWRKKITFLWMLILTAGISLSSESKVFSLSSKEINLPYEDKAITVYLAGDSTVSDYGSSRAPRAGWGQVLPDMLDKRIRVINEASPGRSSKSFIDEGRMAHILNQIHRGDYLFIQFGHNDEKTEDPTRYTEPATTYKSYLKQYIDGARQKEAIPILVTPVERRSFTKDGKALDTHGLYPAAMKELGLEEQVPVIDLTAKSKEMYQQLGPEKTKDIFLWLNRGQTPNYPSGVRDNTHFQEKGARMIAKLVIAGINDLKLPLSDHILK